MQIDQIVDFLYLPSMDESALMIGRILIVVEMKTCYVQWHGQTNFLALDYSLCFLSMSWQSLMKAQIVTVLENEGLELSYNSKWSCAALISTATQAGHRVIEALDHAVSTTSSSMEFLSIASETEWKTAFKSFLHAMSNEALHTSICGVCARECKSKNCLECLHHIPNHELLIPATVHPHMTLTNGLLVADDAIYNTSDVQQAIAVCF